MGNSQQYLSNYTKDFPKVNCHVTHILNPRALLHYSAIGATDQQIAQKWGVDIKDLENLRKELRQGIFT